MSKIALITGITGQDGSYLAELLLEKGYEVHGIIRRSSNFNTQRIDHLYQEIQDNPNLILHYGDLSDGTGLARIVEYIKPDEVYNLGAMSHVRVSFDAPEYTVDVTGTGVVRLLESIRKIDKEVRFYQASSSEMYGSTAEVPQDEHTRFHPRSPYACAKVMAHYLAVNYREAYGMHNSCGILFNHECLTYHMPVLVRKNGYIDVCEIGELVSFSSKGRSKQTTMVDDLEVWDKDDFVKVECVTASRYKGKVRKICSRMGVLETTPEHVWFNDDGSEIPCSEINEGSKLELSSLPSNAYGNAVCTKELAWFMGAMCADGSITDGSAKFINKDQALINLMSELWLKISCGTSNIGTQKSGFTGNNDISNVLFSGDPELIKWLESNLYTKGIHGQKRYKKVPRVILNCSDSNIIREFLSGYCAGDGTKSLPNTRYNFQYTTTSAVLALGIRTCINMVSNVDVTYNIYGNNDSVYKGFIRSERADGVNGQIGGSGKNLIKDQQEVIKVIENDYDGWVFDLATKSHKFTAGAGLNRIHNSERRGETFVTRKITRAATRIKLGLQDKLYLGNLDAKRDWGYAKDYVKAMWMMLQRKKPDDYIIATGETRTVKEFLQVCFDYLDLDVEEYVAIDPRYYRPSEVDVLQGDASKARDKLGWYPETSFEDLARIMIDYDMELAEREKRSMGW